MSIDSFMRWPSFGDDEIAAVNRVLKSGKINYWTGDECRQFEREFATYFGCNHAVSVTNGTVALDLALKALNIRKGDEVVVTPRTFIASVSCIVNAGARPVFADVDPDSQNITVESVQKVITPATRAILCVHIAGWMCEMDQFCDLAKSHDLALIEDCAQAHGATINGRHAGSFAEVSAWSFCQDKIMTTGGEGGMVAMQSKEHWADIWSYKDHGKSWEAIYAQQHPPGFRWIHNSFGTNWRMLELQAVLGRAQLKMLPDWTRTRQRFANRIWDAARECPGLRVPLIPSNMEHAAYKCFVFLEPDQLSTGWDRERILGEIEQRGVPVFTGGCPEVYLEKAFDKTGLRPNKRLPVAKELGETSLMFLVHPTLSEEQIDLCCSVLRDVMRAATGMKAAAV